MTKAKVKIYVTKPSHGVIRSKLAKMINLIKYLLLLLNKVFLQLDLQQLKGFRNYKVYTLKVKARTLKVKH